MRHLLSFCLALAVVATLGLGCGSKEAKMDPSKLTPEDKAQLEQMQKMQEQRMQMVVPAPAAGATSQGGAQRAPGN